MTYVVIAKPSNRAIREMRIATASLTRAAFIASLYVSDGIYASVEIVSR